MLEKDYVQNGAVCKVTFILPREIQAQSVNLAGDFNGWQPEKLPLKQLKNGTWKAQVKLEPGREYQFRYLANGFEWHNDHSADKYVPNPFGGENSVVVT